MIYDNGVDRTNFDSSGLSTGYEEGLLMNECESEILRLIRAQFQGVANQRISSLGSTWQSEMVSKVNQLQNRFVEAFRSRQATIMELMKKSVTNGFSVGIQASKKELSQANIKYPEKEYALNDAKGGQDTILTALTHILEAEAIAITTVLVDYGSTVMLMSREPEQYVGEAFDRIFVPTIEDGLVGKITKSGAKLNLSSYVEGVTRETSQQALLMGESAVADAAGYYLVKISSHASSCPKCTPYQGKIFIDDVYANGKSDGVHELLSVAIASGLFHWNCRHKKTIWIPGNKNASSKEYDEEKVAKNYEIEQQQRALEREIRQQKRIVETSLDPSSISKAQAKQAVLQSKLTELVRDARADGYSIYRQSHKENVGFEYPKKKPY